MTTETPSEAKARLRDAAGALAAALKALVVALDGTPVGTILDDRLRTAKAALRKAGY